jgi:uncharacterized protein (DUF362 family)/NAD-dependent dihydropyrimidine dehydrogenase PreA subunit
MQRFAFERGRTSMVPAWTQPEIQVAVAALFDDFAEKLPEKMNADIVLKPNLNNDLVALTGNSVDLRVLGAALETLRARGYTNLTVADGSNVGVERRGIDTFKRLRVDKLVAHHGARLVDLNHDDGRRFVLNAGAKPRIANTVLESDFLISIPKIKTHCEAQLSCAMKNWVGIARGQEKRHMHYDLGKNIFSINEVVVPDLILVDGLIGMEGNGPGDGEPFRFGQLLMSDNAFLNDVVVCRLIDLPWKEVPYLVHAHAAGHFDDALVAEVEATVPVVRPIKPPPVRTRIAEIAESRKLMWLKKAMRPLTDKPEVLALAHKLRIVQDVYSMQDDGVRGVTRTPDNCGTCTICADFCPTGLKPEEIGVKTGPEDCINCMYCWWVCPDGAIEVDGPLNHLERQVARYKKEIESL